ncbi:unnamed protein product [Prorocentrum cordatum]|uniref:C3H1-type domain-containing protein n=1 Tax=Prorocentrum cordatum TaxID=2364126 RepID=A0ABN9VSF1_9DINO|nr:unnamed protein product [Polarella glacialis]
MRSSLQKRRMSAAADAIHLLPEQLINVVQTKAESLADSVKIDLSLVQKAIRRSGGDGDAVDVAIDQLDKIPGIIRSSFDSKIVDANEAIRTKLSAIMQKFKGRAPESQEVVTQLWTIPEELEQITWEAVDKAVQESQREAASCCDRVLRSLPEDAGSSRRALKDAKSQIVESMPEMYSATMRALRSTTNANVKHAVAYVDDPKDVPVTNHLVADVLLRAKMGPLPHTNGASLYQPSHCAASLLDCVNDAGGDGFLANHRSQWQAGLACSAACTRPSNPGSLGHPEMCVRPCLYFSGRCASGDACKFCHCPHPTRPVHLGRSHRRRLWRRRPRRSASASCCPSSRGRCSRWAWPPTRSGCWRSSRAPGRAGPPLTPGARSRPGTCGPWRRPSEPCPCGRCWWCCRGRSGRSVRARRPCWTR